MSLLNLNIADVKEVKTVPAGTELGVRIASASVGGPSAKGNEYLVIGMEVISEEGVEDIWDRGLVLPREDSEEKENNKRLRRIKAFAESFGWDGVDTDGLQGLEGYIIAGEEDDPAYGVRNTVRRYVVPK